MNSTLMSGHTLTRMSSQGSETNSKLEKCLERFLSACDSNNPDQIRETLFELRRHLLLHGVHAKVSNVYIVVDDTMA